MNMKILKIRVNWMFGWANNPSFQILVDKLPDMEDLRYERKGDLFYAELDGYVSFYCGDPEHPSTGFCGREFNLKMKDGSKVKLIGPWSSRAGVMNKMEFTPCLDVSITDNPEVWERGYTFFAHHTTLELIKEAMEKFLPNIYLVEEKEDIDITYIPSINPDKVVKPPHPEDCKCFQCRRPST